jgi:RNA polymerase sigma-70 factor, ECF subfamily
MGKAGVQSVGEGPGMDALIGRLYEKGRATEFGLSRESFSRILREISAKYLPPEVARTEVEALYAALRVEDLVLARACAAGHEHAWEVFLTRFRAKLYEIAGYIAKEASTARELADSIYADLYGTSERNGQRVSKLASYTGRGSLEGWLRTVMAQEYVNRYRRQRRLVSMDEEVEEGVQFVAAPPQAVQAVDPRIEAATDEALAELPPEDRFILASYYLDSRTLAEIGRTLGVHESTISRKVDKLGKSLRKRILSGLGRRGMSRRQAEEALKVDVRDLEVRVRTRLLQETAEPTFSKKKAEMPSGKSRDEQRPAET